MMFIVQAQIERTTEDGWTGSMGIPTFYVEAYDKQEASKKVDWILNPHGYEYTVHASIEVASLLNGPEYTALSDGHAVAGLLADARKEKQ